MTRDQVKVGLCYKHKGRVVRIKEDNGFNRGYRPAGRSVLIPKRHRGWTAINEATGREVHVSSAAGLTLTCQGSKPSTAGSLHLSNESELAQLDDCLDRQLPRFYGLAVDMKLKADASNYVGLALFISEMPPMAGVPALAEPYKRVCLVEFSSDTVNGQAVRHLKTKELWRLPLPTASRPLLTPEEETAAENCQQLDRQPVKEFGAPEGDGIPHMGTMGVSDEELAEESGHIPPLNEEKLEDHNDLVRNNALDPDPSSPESRSPLDGPDARPTEQAVLRSAGDLAPECESDYNGGEG